VALGRIVSFLAPTDKIASDITNYNRGIIYQ